jgi:uncharacterized protein YdaU (DUF1376 family)
MAEFEEILFDPAAFMADTAHFDTREIGAYLLILFAMWRTRDVRLPLTDKDLSNITKLPPALWAKVRPRIFALPGWEIDHTDPQNVRFTHKKLEQTRMRARKTREVNKANAKARWNDK